MLGFSPLSSNPLSSLQPPVATGAVVVQPGTGALVYTGFAPTVLVPRVVTPGTGALVYTGFAPTVLTPRVVLAGVGALVLTGFAPTVVAGGAQVMLPGTGVLTFTGYAPTVIVPVPTTPSGGGQEIRRRWRGLQKDESWRARLNLLDRLQEKVENIVPAYIAPPPMVETVRRAIEDVVSTPVRAPSRRAIGTRLHVAKATRFYEALDALETRVDEFLEHAKRDADARRLQDAADYASALREQSLAAQRQREHEARVAWEAHEAEQEILGLLTLVHDL